MNLKNEAIIYFMYFFGIANYFLILGGRAKTWSLEKRCRLYKARISIHH
jgi:hypothetical protein